MLPAWRYPTRSWCRCANSPAPVTSWRTGSTARSGTSGAPPTSRSTAPCGRWKTTAGCPRRWSSSAGGRTRRSTRFPTPGAPNWPAGSPSRSPDEAARSATPAPVTWPSSCAASRYGDPAALRNTDRCAARRTRRNCWTPIADSRRRSSPTRRRLRDSALHQYLVLRGGIRAEESTIDWLDEVTKRIARA